MSQRLVRLAALWALVVHGLVALAVAAGYAMRYTGPPPRVPATVAAALCVLGAVFLATLAVLVVRVGRCVAYYYLDSPPPSGTPTAGGVRALDRSSP